MSVFDPLYDAVAHVVVGIHAGLQPVFGKTNGYGWALSIVLLTMGVRLLLFPLFVKQIKSQRTMQTMQPKMKEIREKYKHDRQKMNAELMALQKEHGNPLLGCLPIFAQIPLFFALFHVLNGITPKSAGGVLDFHANHGLTYDQAKTIGSAKVFGVPLAAAFRSSASVLHKLTAGNATAVKGVALVLIVVMCATTYLTQKQIQGRNGPVDPAQRTQQKMMLYLAPGMLAISGFIFPIGVLFYWLTTNLWSMAQQFFVLRRMPSVQPVLATGAARAEAALARKTPVATSAPASKGVRLRKASRPADVAPDHVAPRARLQQQVLDVQPVTAGPGRPTGSRPPKKHAKGGKNRPGDVDKPCADLLPRGKDVSRGPLAGADVPPALTHHALRDLTGEGSDMSEPQIETIEIVEEPTGSATASRKAPDLEQEGDVAADYLEGLLDILDLDGDLDLDVEGDRAVVAIVGSEGLDKLVGRKGETLEALQELTRLAVVTATGARSRLMLDIAGWRAARRTELAELGSAAAHRVLASGTAEKLSPMTAFERKVVHDAAGAVEGIRTESEGDEPQRRVVVLPA